jgi:hypothetical protein
LNGEDFRLRRKTEVEPLFIPAALRYNLAHENVAGRFAAEPAGRARKNPIGVL